MNSRPAPKRNLDYEDSPAAAAAAAANAGGPRGSQPDEGQAAPGEQDESEFECPNNGIFADVASGCQAYHVCQSGAQVQEKFQCPLGTLFNDIILTCDFAHNVHCAKQQAAQPQGNEGQQQTRHGIRLRRGDPDGGHRAGRC